jgi:hypothetical protein
LEGKGAKAGAQAEMEVGAETAVAVAAAPAAPGEPKAGLTAASSVALAKTDGSQDKVTFLPLWGNDFFLLSVIAECCPPQVVVNALKTLDSVPAGVQSYVDVFAGILRVPASIDSAIAMRFAVQHYLREDRTAQMYLMRDVLCNLHDDVTLQGAAMPLITQLLTISRTASPDFIDLAVLYLSARLRMRVLPALARPRKLPFGAYSDYWSVQKVAEEEYPEGQIRSIMTSLVLSPDMWSVDALSLFTSTFISRPIQRAVLTDHRAEAGFLAKTEGIARLSGWLPTKTYRCVGILLNCGCS